MKYELIFVVKKEVVFFGVVGLILGFVVSEDLRME